VVLDTAIPPRRLGRALRAARRSSGRRRRSVAAELGIATRLLVAWERGNARVPDDMAAVLDQVYDNRLRALVPHRAPVRVELGHMVMGNKVRILASTARDDVLSTYVDVLGAVRGAKPGAPLSLRTADLEQLADALGRDTDDIESRIVELLQCTRAEAATLHAELRRRMLVPAASFAVGAAALTGAVSLAPDTEPVAPAPTALHAQPAAAESPVTTTPTTGAPVAPVAPVTSTSSTAPPAPTTGTTEAPTPPAPSPPPATDAAPPTTAATFTTSSAPVDDPPVSILPGETPTIIQP
jgi:hypothetical protein